MWPICDLRRLVPSGGGLCPLQSTSSSLARFTLSSTGSDQASVVDIGQRRLRDVMLPCFGLQTARKSTVWVARSERPTLITTASDIEQGNFVSSLKLQQMPFLDV